VLSLGLALVVFAAPAQAKGYKQLYAFQGGTADGSSPWGALLSYRGEFYGATCSGGTYGAGTIFKLEHNGTGETVLYSFKGGSDGSCPGGALVADQSGNFYDTAIEGGSDNCSTEDVSGCGTVFEFAPNNMGSGTFTLLYTFLGGSDGAGPNLGIIMGKKGELYGTTANGGDGACQLEEHPPGCGTVFELSPQKDGKRKEHVLYAFQGGTGDGGDPLGNLLADGSGNLYGTTVAGGVTTCDWSGVQGCGTVFELSPNGNSWTETVPYFFCSEAKCSDGAWPGPETLIMDNGNLYGTTISGGANSSCGAHGCGTFFELASDGNSWNETVLYSFCTNGYPACSDGRAPNAGPISDGKGNLYSTTVWGGGCDECGTVFELAPGNPWTETVLHSFTGGSDGAMPEAGLIMDKAGNLYSTTTEGGSANCSGGCGTIFKVKE
jgi:uncharacterized repeat protein (TIGR03803 family)